MNWIRLGFGGYFGFRLLQGLHTAWDVVSKIGLNWTGSHDWAIGYVVWLGGLVSSCIMLTLNQKQYRDRVLAENGRIL